MERGLSAENVGEYYDQWTDRYIDSFGDVFQACRPARTEHLIAHIIQSADISPGMRLLDAGCGVCGPSIRIAQAVDVQIDAITISTVQAEIARERVEQAGLSDRITVHQGDFSKLSESFQPDFFDRIVFLESLCHAVSVDQVLVTVHQVLKTDGQVYVKDFFRRHYEDNSQAEWVAIVVGRVEKEFRVRVRDVSDVMNSCTRAGFEQVLEQPVGFESTITEWQQFAIANDLNLYAGGKPIEWSDWIELAYRKPNAEVGR